VRGDTLWVGTRGGILLLDATSGRFLRKITAGDTLPVHEVYAFAEGDAGDLWIGTEAGLTRVARDTVVQYGGGDPTVFARVRSIAPVRGAGLWIGTFDRGAVYTDGDSLLVFTSSDSLLDDRVESVLVENPQRIWFGTGAGLCRIDSSHWDLYDYGHGLPKGNVLDLDRGGGDSLWLAVDRSGVGLLVGGRGRTYHVSDGLPTEFVRCLEVDGKGRVWVGGLGGGLRYFDGSGWIRPRGLGEAFERAVVTSMTSDSLGNLWVGTQGDGIYHHRTGLWARFDPPPGPPPGAVRQVVEGPEGRPLFLTSAGVWTWGGAGFRPFAPLAGLTGSEVQRLFVSGDEILAAGRWGIQVAGRKGILSLGGGTGLRAENVLDVCRDPSGRLWVGTHDRGVWSYDGEIWIQYTIEDGLAENRAERLVVDRKGDLWCTGGLNGVSRFHAGEWRTFTPENSGLPGRKVADLTLGRRGDLLVAGPYGVCRFESERWICRAFPTGLGKVRVTGLAAGLGPDEIWVGTRGRGLLRLERDVWNQWNRTRTFPEDWVRSLHWVGDVLWLGVGGGGIYRLTPADRGKD
jgi:ligand-binding sensor domain-containing protein